MKKALCLFLAAALTLTLWACGAPETAIQKLESPPAARTGRGEWLRSRPASAPQTASTRKVPEKPP